MKAGIIEWYSEGFGPIISYLYLYQVAVDCYYRDYYTSIIVNGNFVVTQLQGGRFEWQMLSGIEKTGS